jgi:hypothetical protein
MPGYFCKRVRRHYLIWCCKSIRKWTKKASNAYSLSGNWKPDQSLSIPLGCLNFMLTEYGPNPLQGAGDKSEKINHLI